MLNPPTIEIIDRTSVELAVRRTERGLVEVTSVPQRFRASFSGDRSTSIEIEMVDGSPLVRSYSVATDTEDLAARPLRPPLNGKLVPAAVRAACYSKFRRDVPIPAASLSAAGDVGVIGPITLVARIRSRTDEYGKAANRSAPRRRGRPPLTPEELDLDTVVAKYKQKGSLTKAANDLPMSRSTVGRRMATAREQGLLD